MNWSCVLQSTISDIEVTHVNVDKRSLFDIPGYRYLCVIIIIIIIIHLVDSCHSGICNKQLNLKEYFCIGNFFSWITHLPSGRGGGWTLMHWIWINKGKIFLNKNLLYSEILWIKPLKKNFRKNYFPNVIKCNKIYILYMGELQFLFRDLKPTPICTEFEWCNLTDIFVFMFCLWIILILF